MDGRTKSGHDGLRRGRLRCCDCPLTSVPVYVTSGANHLARKGRRRGGKLRRWGERRSPRAGLQPVPGRSGHHARRHYDRRARCVAGSGCGRRRVISAALVKHPPKPGPDRTKGPHTPWEEPWWNAGRRAAPSRSGGGAAPQGAEVTAQRPFRRSISFIVIARNEETKRSRD